MRKTLRIILRNTFVPLSLSSLLLVRSAFDDLFFSTTESFMDKSSIIFTSWPCSVFTEGPLLFSAASTETSCTASLLRCSSSPRFLDKKKSARSNRGLRLMHLSYVITTQIKLLNCLKIMFFSRGARKMSHSLVINQEIGNMIR